MDGTASAGSSDLYSRGDHVHPTDTSRASKEELDALIKTSQSLIDQSFTYRESPAIQGGLSRIDKIKGNTLLFNQLVQNGNFADTSGWQALSDASFTAANNICSGTLPNTSSNIRTDVKCTKGHKYLLISTLKTTASRVYVSVAGVGPIYFTSTEFETKGSVFTWGANSGQWALYIKSDASQSVNIETKNIMLIDLTLMGIDVTFSQFGALFPLPYYQFDSGSLLSFNGTGLKTENASQTESNILS